MVLDVIEPDIRGIQTFSGPYATVRGNKVLGILFERKRAIFLYLPHTTPPKEVFHLQVRMISTFENNWGPCIVFGDHGGCLGQIYPLPRERLLDDDLYNTRIGDRVIIKYNSLSARILISTLSCNVMEVPQD